MTLSHAMGTPARCCGKESSERFATSHGAYSNSSTGGGFSIRCFARYVGQAKITCSARILVERLSTRIRAEHVIFACPTYLAKHLMEKPPPVEEFEYAPWLVANLSLDSFPQQRAGVPIAWDNVIYDSDSLGYVVATHQRLNTYQR